LEVFLKALLLGSHGLFAYLGIFSVLIACGLGVPLPEDLSLILGGYLAHQGAVVLPGMMAVGFVGILMGDSLIYLAGRRLGTRGASRSSFLSHVVTPEKRAKVEAMFASHGEKIVMAARFLPGIRAVTYFTAGSAGMSYRRFILFDAVAAMASAPLFVLLGSHFGSRIDWLAHRVREFQLGILGFVVVAGVTVWALRRRRHTQASRAGLVARAESSVVSSPVALSSASQVKLAD
jgi:membrane protein DedA with SNARE-associated domain